LLTLQEYKLLTWQIRLPTRGEHGQDQDWISCRILAIFFGSGLDLDIIVEKHWIRIFKFIVMGRGTARSSNQAPNNATQTKQKAHKQE